MPQTPPSALPEAFLPLAQLTGSMMLFRDPPGHTRLRALVNKAFTPRVAENLASRIQLITDDLMDTVAAARQLDVIADLAFPLPVTGIAELLGMPVTDQALLRTWSVGFTHALDVRQEEECSRSSAMPPPPLSNSSPISMT